MIKRFLQLNDLSCYVSAFNLSNYVWNIVIKWDHFEKRTIGDQFIRAIDSISANIAEGFGRYSKKDKIKFYRYSFGSTKESLDWNEKARIRKLLTQDQYNLIYKELNELPKEIYSLINYTEKKLTV